MLTVLQFLSYNVLIGYGILGQFHFDPFMQWLVYTPFYALLIGDYLFYRRRPAVLMDTCQSWNFALEIGYLYRCRPWLPDHDL